MKNQVEKYDARFWAESFMKTLTSRRQKVPAPVKIPLLTLENISKIRQSRQRALFLDYDGTLAELTSLPENAVPSGEVEDILFSLSRQDRFEVYIAAGRKREQMDRWFSKFGLNLIAEHGYCYREKKTEEWIFFAPEADLSWKDQLRDFLNLYTGMTPGSFLEEKTASLVWHYRNSDPEFGAWKAHQLVAELQEILSNLPVEIHHGKKNVTIASAYANKGSIVSHLMTTKNHEAAICAGDDETDESMFRLTNLRITGIKIGDGNQETAAGFRCPSPKAFRAFLGKLLSGSGNKG